jgi:hypothetical protein
MDRNRILVIALTVIIVVALVWFFYPSPASPPTKP